MRKHRPAAHDTGGGKSRPDARVRVSRAVCDTVTVRVQTAYRGTVQLYASHLPVCGKRARPDEETPAVYSCTGIIP